MFFQKGRSYGSGAKRGSLNKAQVPKKLNVHQIGVYWALVA
jgi:hypothetical protein